MLHRYKVGQMLDLRSAPRHSNRPMGPYEVIACLPHDRGPVLYRVKSSSETNERVLEETDLIPGTATKSAVAEGESFFSIAIGRR